MVNITLIEEVRSKLNWKCQLELTKKLHMDIFYTYKTTVK